MNCHEYQDAILDFARHGLDADGERSLGSHLEGCPACADRLKQQQALNETLDAVRAATSDEIPSAALETRLLERFVAHHAATTVSSVAPSRSVRAVPSWMKVAAALLCATAALASWWLAAPRPERSTATMADPPRQPAVVPAPRPATPVAAASPAPPRVSRPSPRPRRQTRVLHPDGFVPLPASAGLPSFESGEIVRMEIPLTSLPNYGVPISPDASDTPIQADLLVGQDGQPRAIRLVTRYSTAFATQDSRSRQ